MSEEQRKQAAKVPSLWLEQAALGELSEQTAAKLNARMGEADQRSMQQELARSNEQILDRLPPSRMVKVIAQRAERERKQRRVHAWMPGPWTLAPVVTLAALLLIVLKIDSDPTLLSTQQPAKEHTRIKGLSPHLVLYRRQGDQAERLALGARARAGDVLQVAYVAAGQRYGVIVSIDGAGAVTPHLQDGSRAAPLARERETLLTESYQLDAAPSFERFVLVTGPHAFATSVVLDAARALGRDPARAQDEPLQLPAGLQQMSFRVTKVQP